MMRQMSPEEEFNLRIHIRVMGVFDAKYGDTDVPRYSQDMNEAVKVLEVMRKNGHRWLIVSSEEGYFLRHLASVSHDAALDEKRYTADRPIGQVATTPAELAKLICEAAYSEVKRTEG